MTGTSLSTGTVDAARKTGPVHSKQMAKAKLLATVTPGIRPYARCHKHIPGHTKWVLAGAFDSLSWRLIDTALKHAQARLRLLEEKKQAKSPADKKRDAAYAPGQKAFCPGA